jgi:type VI secretion system protein VasG
MIDAILTNTVLPAMSQEILTRTLDGRTLSRVALSAREGDFVYDYAD